MWLITHNIKEILVGFSRSLNCSMQKKKVGQPIMNNCDLNEMAELRDQSWELGEVNTAMNPPATRRMTLAKSLTRSFIVCLCLCGRIAVACARALALTMSHVHVKHPPPRTHLLSYVGTCSSTVNGRERWELPTVSATLRACVWERVRGGWKIRENVQPLHSFFFIKH